MFIHDTLPHLVFFEPTAAFIEYLERIAPNRQVIDVGAGAGFLSRTLADRGFKVLAIDIIDRVDPLYPIHLMDATEFNFPKGILPIMARPCHDDWTQVTIRNALKTTGKIIYVGLTKNFPKDLCDLHGYRKQIQPFVAGKDGELVIEITKPTKGIE